jgi:hypothetical protein
MELDTSIPPRNNRYMPLLLRTFLSSTSPAPPPPALTFSDACGDWMVLQMAPAKAAVSGLLNVSSPASVEVSVSGGGASYKVQATVTKLAPDPENPGPAGFKWKAFLHPA